MPLLRRMYPMGSFILTFMALLLLQSALLVPLRGGIDRVARRLADSGRTLDHYWLFAL